MAVSSIEDWGDRFLTALFASKARIAVLRVFLLDPRRAYYQRQIAAAAGLALRGVQAELERLTQSGLLYRRTEGKRAYYRVDLNFPYFPELRSMVLKSGTDYDRLRGYLAMVETIHLAFLHGPTNRVLAVTRDANRTTLSAPKTYVLQVMTGESFDDALQHRDAELTPFLAEGVDLLGRRDDIIWHRIQRCGYDVPRGKGVP